MLSLTNTSPQIKPIKFSKVLSMPVIFSKYKIEDYSTKPLPMQKQIDVQDQSSSPLISFIISRAYDIMWMYSGGAKFLSLD